MLTLRLAGVTGARRSPMRIGYPCKNLSVPCIGDRTFRLRSYGRERLLETVASNLACLETMLRWNHEHGLLFFRITSQLVPFASHPVMRVPWQQLFAGELRRIGRLARRLGIRLSMHPDQFTLINSLDPAIFDRAHAELRYHAEVLDLMGAPLDAKIQIHLGGVYGDKPASLARFCERYVRLDAAVRRRLVVENDDRLFTFADCLQVSRAVRAPVVFDVLHHRVCSSGESLPEALALQATTWRRRDGAPMVDYSTQAPGGRPGKHAESLDRRHFGRFLRDSRPHDVDLMLEIKDKEASACRALAAARGDMRLVTP